MSTLAVVEEILRETAIPMSVREIVERAGARLPSKSKTPDTVVARDLSMDIKKRGEGSLFIRTSPGRYTLRALVSQPQGQQAHDGDIARAVASPLAAQAPNVSGAPSVPMAQVGSDRLPGLAARKPAAPAAPAARPGRTDSAEGGGYVG